MKRFILIAVTLIAIPLCFNARADWKEELPRPVYESNPGFVELYYKAWELAYAHIDSIPGLPTPRYMDEAHASNLIWIWDTCFMTQFCKYCPSVFPGIESLDNFYELMLSKDRKESRVMTIASYWPLLAWVASDGQAAEMLRKLDNPEYFGGFVPTCSLSRGDADFVATGGYWRGSVWMPTSYMALKAADQYGAGDIAKKEAVQILEHMYRTYIDYEPHTIWECYSPTEFKPATNKKGQTVRPDFCGWSALGPISLFIEDVIGIREANAFTGNLVCDFEKNSEGRVGVENYRFGDIVCSVIADKRTIVVDSNKPFTLVEDGKKHRIKKGHNRIIRK